jgi:RimJ/RimL family protein N-acetyltransferase
VRAVPDRLKTERLILRHWRPSDQAPFARLNGDRCVMRSFARTRTPEESRAEIERFDASFDRDGLGFWAVEAPGVAEFIGFVGCYPVNPALPFAPGVEAGWRLDRTFWGRGYAPEAARAALADTFGLCGLPEIVADAAVPNLPFPASDGAPGDAAGPGRGFRSPARSRGASHAPPRALPAARQGFSGLTGAAT